MHNVRWNTIPVCYVAIEKWKFKVICTCLRRSYLQLKLWFLRVFGNTLKSKNIWGSLSQCPKIILYICTKINKQINFLRNSSEGHFRTPSLSRYSFSDLQMTWVARLCIDSILLMCVTKYGFQSWQPYSKIGRTKDLYAVETPSELFGPKVRLIKPRTLLAI